LKPLIHIAIDGPTASGKGTASAKLSRRLNIPCLDTGAIYRGVAVAYRETNSFDNIDIVATIKDGTTHISLNGTDVTHMLRDNDISQIASKVATIPEVRKLCTKISQDLASRQSLIAEGRDICSVVLANAKHKFYLNADVNVRAKRRYDELVEKGKQIPFEQVLAETKERDQRDATKGGLVKTFDAIEIDNTEMTIDQVVDTMLEFIFSE
jgi:cytidylate kinase